MDVSSVRSRRTAFTRSLAIRDHDSRRFCANQQDPIPLILPFFHSPNIIITLLCVSQSAGGCSEFYYACRFDNTQRHGSTIASVEEVIRNNNNNNVHWPTRNTGTYLSKLNLHILSKLMVHYKYLLKLQSRFLCLCCLSSKENLIGRK